MLIPHVQYTNTAVLYSVDIMADGVIKPVVEAELEEAHKLEETGLILLVPF